VALSLVLAACGGGDDGGQKSDGDSSAQATPTPEVPAIWPLTGLEAEEGQSVELDRPVVVTKIDNSPASSPQVGLSKADLVVEELVEGGITRLAAFYYSQLPGDIGPVRSMRASDIGIVSPVGGVIATSGAAPQTIARIDRNKITYFGEGGPGFYRNSGRHAPYNLFTDLRKVAKAAEDGTTERPADYLPWGTEEDFAGGAPAPTISAHFGSRTTNWRFENGTYTNTNSNAARGDHFQPSSILVLRVKVVDAGYTDPAGNFVPESRFEGKGAAQLFHNGQVVEGTWAKDKIDSALTLTTADGAELKVPAGKTWIELVPVDANDGSVTIGQ